MKYSFKFFFFFMLFSNVTFAQNVDLGSWNILNIKYNVNNKWSLFAEGQIRSLLFYDNFHYYEYKGGFTYKLYNNLSFTLAAGSYQTYREGGDFRLPKNNDEFRLWPQIVLSQTVGKLKIEQRYRAELRYTSNGYRTRFRYRFGAAYPLGKAFQIGASNELFFTNKEPYFERNRLAFSLNYKLSSNSTVLIGYLHQFDYKINDETGRDFLQIGYFLELNHKQ